MYDPLASSQRCELVFLCIASPSAILVSHAIVDGNWNDVLLPIFAEAKEDQKLSISYNDDYHIHYISRRGFIAATVADSDFSRQLAFTCLREVEQFAATDFAQELQDDAKMFLAQILGYYNANQDADKLAQLKKRLEEVNDVMILNFSKALTRCEKAELLVNRCKIIKGKAQAFKLQSKTVKHFMYVRRNPKQVILIITVIVAVLVVGLALYCEDETWHQCLGGS